MAPDVAPPLPLRFRVIHAGLVVFALALVGRAAWVQLWQHDRWAAAAVRQQLAEAAIPAPRGDIEDATGLPIAYSRELVSLSVAPPEVKDVRKLTRAMLDAGIPASEVRRAANRKRRWVDLRGRYLPARVAPVLRFNGVHVSNVGDRVYVQSAGTRQLLGAVGREGRGLSGLELFLDSLLLGTEGRSRAVKGLRGLRFESPDTPDEPPGRGHTVRLTINQTVQNICDKALADAVTRLRADGGDVVVLDPRSGEVRCLAGRRPAGRMGGVTALIEPYEPGSTLKPFLAARLLERGLAAPDEMVATFNGTYRIDGRVISDVHKAERLSLRDVIRFSSNVGIVRFAERLSDGEMYELLRDLGFGSPTGLPYPSEAAGRLYEPRTWSRQSHESLAIGYELTVTPLQLALAYTALANDGLLVAPALIREIRDAEDRVVYTHRRRVLRRVFSEQAVNTVIPMLESVVDSGTAVDASLAGFPLAGKSGTARRTVGGVYGRSTYTSTFVGIFPARAPQYVVLAKIDNPREESIYGGKVAAPLARAVIEGALGARDASLDWDQLLSQQRQVAVTPAAGAPGEAGAAAPAAARPSVPLIDTTPEPEPLPAMSFDLARPVSAPSPAPRMVSVPDVSGLPLRVAVRQLHRAGLEVALVGGTGSRTTPAAGARVRTGTVVRLTRP